MLAFDRSPVWLRSQRSGLAFDFKSTRSKTEDGHLQVAQSNISKANICPYLGKEIPGFEELGLEAEKIYQLLRDPAELEKAAPTFNNLPILSEHVPITADDHRPELVIGSTGSSAKFSDPFLSNNLAFWAQPAIDDIEREEKRDLSSAYRYRADMTPGIFKGEKFDGVMRDIRGNHVALVKRGRAGADVVVGDSMERITMAKKGFSRAAALAGGALMVYLAPKLAKDAAIDLGPVLAGLTAKNFKPNRDELVKRIGAVTKGKLAKDASIEDVAMMLDTLAAHPAAIDDDDPLPKDPLDLEDDDDDKEKGGFDAEPLKQLLQGKLSEDDFKAACDMIGGLAPGAVKPAAVDNDPKLTELGAAGDNPPPFPGMPKTGADEEDDEDKDKEPKVDKKAMDAAIEVAVSTATKNATKAALGTAREIRDAERFVRPWVGEIAIACDSAPAVFKIALDALKVDTKDMPEAAYKAVLAAQPKPSTDKREPVVALDAAGMTGFFEMYPGANSIRLA